MIRIRTAGSLAGLILSTVLVAGPAVAASVPSPQATAPAAASFSFRCAAEWIAAHGSLSVAAWQAVGDCDVDRRLETISRVRSGIASATVITADHRSALNGILDASQSGLTTLRAKIDGDTTLASLRVDDHAIFADYRIYALVARQAALVRGDDAVAAAAARLTDGAAKIQTAITTAQGKGKDVTVATTQLAAMQAAIASALAKVSGDTAAVLALTPAGWNAGTAGPVLDAARASIKGARADLAAALADGKAAIAALK